MVALVATAAVVVTSVVVVASRGGGSGDPALALIRVPTIDGGEGCGAVASRPATPEEAAQVVQLPASLPAGYRLAAPATTTVQERQPAGSACWTADVTYIDPVEGHLLAVTVGRQGGEVQPDCQVPDGYRPVECTVVAGRPAGLTHEGRRATLAWVSSDGDLVTVSAHGLTTEVLAAAAASVTFDGTDLALEPPPGMHEVDRTSRTPTDDRTVTYFGATFTNGDPTADVELAVTTWDDVSVNEVGPARTLDLPTATALVVTTGGPDTGIITWTNEPGASDPLRGVTPVPAPRAAYVTWNRAGLTFRLSGSDPAILVEIARQLRPS
ncbi:MAG: hypothetical protein AB7L84_00280 [Acidimicrobiia bacterium]